MIVIDSEWNWKTGEFLGLGVWKDGRYKGYTDLEPARMKRDDVYYFASTRDVQFFREKFGDDFNFIEIGQIEKTIFNVSGGKDKSERLTSKVRKYGIPLADRPESHLYVNATPAMMRDLREDVHNTVNLTHYLKSQLEIARYGQPTILREWGEGNYLYAEQHTPVLIDKGFISDLADLEKMNKVVDLLDIERKAFEVKSKIVKSGPYKGTERIYVHLNQAGLQQLYEDLGLEYLNQTNLGGKAYGVFRKDIFNSFNEAEGVLDRAYQIRVSEDIADVNKRIALFVIILLRTARVLGEVCVPLIIPKATSSGRSKHSISPYNMGGLVRANIYAGEGRAILSFDISGQELRLAAYLSQDAEMLKVANSSEKYSLLAEILGYPATAGKKGSSLREMIKTVWLQYQYGGGAALLFANGIINKAQQAYQLSILKSAFSDYEAWKRDLLGKALRDGYVEASPGNYRLYYNVGNSESARAHNARQIQNFVVQGGAAAVVYPWLLDIKRRLLPGDYIACELYDGNYLNVDIDNVDYYLDEIPKSARVWDERFPMSAPWSVEAQPDKRNGKMYFTKGVVEKEKYVEMLAAWEKVMGRS